jgi:threonine synthase
MLDLAFTPTFRPEMAKGRKPTMWRYREAIPVTKEAAIVSFDEGFTPMLEVDFGGRGAWIKQDHLFPTGSYKDRGASVLVSQARAMGVEAVVEDSSGNAGCAIAAYCARAGIRADIYVPGETAAAKLAQIEHYGARLFKVAGSREDTARAALEAAEKTYYASHSWNQFFFHGTKTFAYEVTEQLGWKGPDTVVLPVGNGTLLLGASIGFEELLKAGVIRRRPKLIGVQAENCAPLAHAFRKGLADIEEEPTQGTLGEGIAIARPIRARQILEAVRKSGGDFVTVTEEEIERSLREMCGLGYYIEPTSAATTAGVARYVKQCGRDEVIVSVFTGHGLKTTEKMVKLL